MARARKEAAYSLEIPLDASKIEDVGSGQEIKVVAKDREGNLTAQTVKIGRSKKAVATLRFEKRPGPLHVAVGPADATDQELQGLQTLTVRVPTRQWANRRVAELAPVMIHPYYWYWWWRWCRTFTVRGKVVCPDGSPVPAATVCAYDVDRFFIWSSIQQVGCAVTDPNGAFEITFRWCCGWWPWWWWRWRIWQRDPILVRRIGDLALRNPDLRLSPTPSEQPTLEVFKDLLLDEGLDTRKVLRAEDVNSLETVRDRLLAKLPAAPELERLRIWPWYPWYPWWDCHPDLIFRVTQDCEQQDTVIVDETISDTRWGIPQVLDNVTLVANELACCRSICDDPPCDEGECLVYARVCGYAITNIGGNTGAPATPEGYARPNAVPAGTAGYNGDRPFGGVVNVAKNSGDMVNVDYYSVQYHDGVGWNPLPAGAGLTINRGWLFWDGTDWFDGSQAFPYDSATFPGFSVYQSREHFEANGPFSDWWPGGGRFWITNEFLVMRLNSKKFSDGTYRFRVLGYQVDASGNLINEQVLPLCASQQDNNLVLTFDNRVIDPLLDTVSNPCSTTITNCTVHLCTSEPTTDFIAVRIGGVNVDACDVVDSSTGMLEIDFQVHDPDGHLGGYTLFSKYKENQYVPLLSLLSQPGASLVSLAADDPGPTYGQALASAGVTAPHWYGGTMRLTVPADLAFPEPCCYQLELRAVKRTIVSCDSDYDHCNLSEYTLGVGVCPPLLAEPPQIERAVARVREPIRRAGDD